MADDGLMRTVPRRTKQYVSTRSTNETPSHVRLEASSTASFYPSAIFFTLRTGHPY